jgi:Ca2+-binding RTX toxin-like protein
VWSETLHPYALTIETETGPLSVRQDIYGSEYQSVGQWWTPYLKQFSSGGYSYIDWFVVDGTITNTTFTGFTPKFSQYYYGDLTIDDYTTITGGFVDRDYGGGRLVTKPGGDLHFLPYYWVPIKIYTSIFDDTSNVVDFNQLSDLQKAQIADGLDYKTTGNGDDVIAMASPEVARQLDLWDADSPRDQYINLEGGDDYVSLLYLQAIVYAGDGDDVVDLAKGDTTSFDTFDLFIHGGEEGAIGDTVILPGKPEDYSIESQFYRDGTDWDHSYARVSFNVPTWHAWVADLWNVEHIKFDKMVETKIEIAGSNFTEAAHHSYGIYPDATPTGGAWGWYGLTPYELGIKPSNYKTTAEGRYDFANGYYRLEDTTAKNHDAAAIAQVGVVNGERTLSVIFKGTDTFDIDDWQIDLFDGRHDYYEEFRPLVDGLIGYINDAANGIEKVLVTGHSLGGATAQIFTAELLANVSQPVQTITFGSIGGTDASLDAGGVITNFVHVGDIVRPFFSSRVAGNIVLIHTPGDTGPADEHFMAGYEADLLLLQHYADTPGNAFYDSDLGLAMRDDKPWVGHGLVQVAPGTHFEETIDVDPMDDTVVAGGGNDTIVLPVELTPFNGRTVIDGGSDEDIIVFSEWSEGITIDLSLDGIRQDPDLGQIYLSNVEGVVGTDEKDHLYGNDGRNNLIGGAGGDILDGRAGGDYLSGGQGNDTYYVDDAADIVAEVDNEGVDTVVATTSFSILDYWTSIEQLVTSDAEGNAAISLFGNSANQRIEGNAGRNLIDGGGGRDLLVGGGGNDTYRVLSWYEDVPIDDTSGRDTILTNDSFSLARFADIEDMILDHELAGWSNQAKLVGNHLRNMLGGDDYANILDGGGNIDHLVGGDGDDLYIVDNLKDIVEEAAGGQAGTRDKIEFKGKAGDVFELPANVEHIYLTGKQDTGARGSADANVLVGNKGKNYLDGGLGVDELTGAGGKDVFAFTTALGKSNVDRIVRFDHRKDKIGLDDGVFTSVGSTLDVSEFVARAGGKKAHTESERIIYNPLSGKLFFDQDGSKKGFAAIHFATLLDKATLDHADFLIV